MSIEINDSFRPNDSSNSNNHLELPNTHYNTNFLKQSQYYNSQNQNNTQEYESNSFQFEKKIKLGSK